MDICIYGRVSSEGQDYNRQLINIKKVAKERNWNVRRIFTDKISGNVQSDSRPAFKQMVEYMESNGITIVAVSEVSRLSRTVLGVLQTVETLHKNGIGVYVQQFNMISLERNIENPMVMLLLQVLAMGAQMENSIRAERQAQGIEIAKLKGKYSGRSKGAKKSRTAYLNDYKDVTELLEKSDLSLRKISILTNHSINTVRKVKKLLIN
ncbi:transposase [Marivirga lumbricoides]|uniref:Transposase n=1 Tax=Marivirga lumbricoides TaxID=1046115 RepID=A0ABQ1N767_9BACT|nr:transposase [Marivirga lumbricoides]